jgi:hypothetical protein
LFHVWGNFARHLLAAEMMVKVGNALRQVRLVIECLEEPRSQAQVGKNEVLGRDVSTHHIDGNIPTGDETYLEVRLNAKPERGRNDTVNIASCEEVDLAVVKRPYGDQLSAAPRT